MQQVGAGTHVPLLAGCGQSRETSPEKIVIRVELPIVRVYSAFVRAQAFVTKKTA